MKKLAVTMLMVVLIASVISCTAPTPTQTPDTQVGPSTSPVTPTTSTISTPEQKWKKILEAARKEREVMVYSGVGPQVKDSITKALQQKYGIEAQFVSGRAAEVATKIISERRAGLYLADGIIVGGGNRGPSNLIRTLFSLGGKRKLLCLTPFRVARGGL